MTIVRALTLATLLASALAGQTPAATPAPQVKPAEPDLATLRAMKSKIFEIKHRHPTWLANSLRVLGSGVRGAQIDSNDQNGLNTISVRDFPENLTLIEEAIQRLDVPSAASKAPDMELHVQVLFASKQPSPVGSIPEELQGVVKSLKGALAYRGYMLAASFVQRWDIRSGRMIQGKGQIEGSALNLGTPKDPSLLRLEWEANSGLVMDQGPNAPASLQIPKFQFFVTEERSGGSSHSLAKIETGVSLKEGEHVVVGTSVIKDQGLVIVLTARRVN